jgi:hypothetical protein
MRVRRAHRMKPDKKTLAKLGVAQAAGFVALTFATPAQATDDPPLPNPQTTPVVAAATGAVTAESPVESAGDSVIEQEVPANVPLAASATTQQEDPSRLPPRVISVAPAQKSPDRAAPSNGWHQVRPRAWFRAQYHGVARRYHALAAPRSRAPRARQHPARFSVRITAKSELNQLPNCPRKLGLNVFQVSGPDCVSDTNELPTLSAFVLHAGACRTAGTQYHPAGSQYQDTDGRSCRASSGGERSTAPPAPEQGPIVPVHSTLGHSAERTAPAQPQQSRAVQTRTPSPVARRTPERRSVQTPALRPRAAPGEPGKAGDSLLLSTRVTLLAGFALVLLAAAFSVGPLLRSRLQSRGLSNRPTVSRRRGGIRYRD